jgi:hypothetical protein
MSEAYQLNKMLKCRVNVEKKIVSLLYNKEKASNAFFGTNVNKSVYFFVYGFQMKG